MTATYVRLDLDEGRLLRSVTEEGSITDADLDELEDRILHGALEPSLVASLALTIARAGRPKSIWALKSARSRLVAARRDTEVQVLDLALDLASSPVPSRLERGESGYRWTPPASLTSARADAEPLYVEDPIAAYWHRRDRWGPPLRPDPSRPPRVATAPGPVEPWLAEIEDGGTVLVCFEPAWPWTRPEPPLRLVRAGMARDAALTVRVRWSQVGSVGKVTRGRTVRAAYEVHGEPREMLPREPAIGVDALVALMSKLVERSRQ